jgi:RND family efflux transporter MFP subunit
MRSLEAMVLAVAVSVAGASMGCRHETADEGESTAPVTKQVRCAPAKDRVMRDTLEIHGTIAPLPDRDAQIAAQVSGRILRMLVREGDRVKRGQPLALIDASALADQAKQAQAQVAKARAESGLAGTSRARVQRVFDRGIAARQELDDATARLSTAEASEAEARAAAGIARRQLERATVRSPLDGVVLRVFHKSGELVDGTAASPLVEVGDPSSLELVGTAPAATLVRCRRGAAATIELPALPTLHLSGVVAAVSPAVDRATGLGVVRISVDFGHDVAPPVGVTATAHVDGGGERHALVAPAEALRAPLGAQAEVVVCGADKHAHVVHVRRGATSGSMVEIEAETVDGGAARLAAETALVVDPVLGIADGDPIERR